MEKKIATIYDLYRMCINRRCNECPLLNSECSVRDCDKKELDEVNKVAIQWCEEHPVKTRQSEFLKMFPNAELCNGVIKICPKLIDSWEGCDDHCQYCQKEYWLQEIE